MMTPILTPYHSSDLHHYLSTACVECQRSMISEFISDPGEKRIFEFSITFWNLTIVFFFLNIIKIDVLRRSVKLQKFYFIFFII